MANLRGGRPNYVSGGGGRLPIWWTPEAIAGVNMNNAQAAANQANERRYQQAMGELQNLRRQNMADVAGQGGYARQQISQNNAQLLARLRQEMTQRGLAHSTVLPMVLAGANRQMNQEIVGLNESLARQRMDARTQATSALVNLIASKRDAAPNPGMVAGLGQGYGAGGGSMAQMAAMAQMGQPMMDPRVAWGQHLARLAALQRGQQQAPPPAGGGFWGGGGAPAGGGGAAQLWNQVGQWMGNFGMGPGAGPVRRDVQPNGPWWLAPRQNMAPNWIQAQGWVQ